MAGLELSVAQQWRGRTAAPLMRPIRSARRAFAVEPEGRIQVLSPGACGFAEWIRETSGLGWGDPALGSSNDSIECAL